MDTGMVKLHNTLEKETEQTIFKSRDHSKHQVTAVNVANSHLWNQVLLNPLQLGLFSAIFCHHCLFIEFMSKISILVVVQRAANTTRKHQYENTNKIIWSDC